MWRSYGHRPDDGCRKLLWNAGKYLPDYTVKHTIIYDEHISYITVNLSNYRNQNEGFHNKTHTSRNLKRRKWKIPQYFYHVLPLKLWNFFSMSSTIKLQNLSMTDGNYFITLRIKIKAFITRYIPPKIWKEGNEKFLRNVSTFRHLNYGISSTCLPKSNCNIYLWQRITILSLSEVPTIQFKNCTSDEWRHYDAYKNQSYKYYSMCCGFLVDRFLWTFLFQVNSASFWEHNIGKFWNNSDREKMFLKRYVVSCKDCTADMDCEYYVRRQTTSPILIRNNNLKI
jgi:hypothetical protein